MPKLNFIAPWKYVRKGGNDSLVVRFVAEMQNPVRYGDATLLSKNFKHAYWVTNMKFRMTQKKIALLITVFAVIMSAIPVKAQSLFTEEEQEYINSKGTLKAVSIDGTAPIQYYDANGQVKGISINVLDAISDLTGLQFAYELYNTVDEVKNSNTDIIFGILENNQLENVPLSIPYLETETILYIHSSVNPNELDNKKYAAIKGVLLPEGVKEENAIYYDTREMCIDAVNRGEADYGYGNAYSVAFYALQNGYKNIITVPEGKEARAYCIGSLNNDEMLISIINKAISSIDESHMNTLILNAATQIERKITIPMILDAYGIQIFGTIVIIMTILLISIVYNVRAKNEIKIQYERYQILSQTSNEYLYEYHVKTKRLELSKNCIELFGDNYNLSELTTAIEKALIHHETIIPSIELPIAGSGKHIFKSVNSFLYDDKEKVYSVIGKLIDIHEEETEKKKLIKKSETDGLTGIYNAITTRNLITERIKSAGSNVRDALIVIDCDKYKYINDTYGHLQGDMVLVKISKGLIQIFRKTDIIGRIGGDEFCVYMKNIPSSDFVISKCQQLKGLIKELSGGFNVTVSMGIALLGDETSYDDLFKKADKALYDAKKKGGDRIQFFSKIQ